MKTVEEFMKGCEHDGSYIPVNQVKRLMKEYADQAIEAHDKLVKSEIMNRINSMDQPGMPNATWGDTDYESEAVAYGYNTALDDVFDFVLKLERGPQGGETI